VRFRTRLLAALAALIIASVGALGTKPAVAQAAPSAMGCKAGYYKNVDGKCVHRPTHAATHPAGASAKCRDGTYSFSMHRSGTCSHHGGVAVWY
jgi:hypothetical protein